MANQEEEIGIHAQSGTRITNEFDKTTFGNWVMVAPGDTETAYFVYRLPFKVKVEGSDVQTRRKQGLERILASEKNEGVSRYSLLAQKQSGIDSDFATQIIYSAGWSPVWSTGEEMQLAANGGVIFNF